MVVGEIIQEKELVIIGGGPGGYTAAIRAAQLGQNVTLIEKDQLGGVCLNKGCIPSKVYTHAAGELDNIPHLSDLGIETQKPSIQLLTLLDYKNRMTDQLKKGVEALCKANKIEVIEGEATFLSKDRIGVESGHDFQTFRFKTAILAAGGKPTAPPGMTVSSRTFLSYEIFSLTDVPEHLIIQVTDVIDLEMATTFHSFGSKVTILLEKDKDLPFDPSISKELKRLFKKKKITLVTDCTSIQTADSNDGVTVTFHNKNGEETTVEASHFYTTGTIGVDAAALGIDRLKMDMTKEGLVHVDGQLQTSIQNIYAIGDLTPGPARAVKA
ncbi:FAD-dependent oxidoreductase, partial [Sporosarcina sp. GW1-11]|uniref:FAD-dependent oxidoreductase n=1 Tax=Sporosarcina sp. GW1-11 TaxID=2899126 RepID=UPI00294E413D